MRTLVEPTFKIASHHEGACRAIDGQIASILCANNAKLIYSSAWKDDCARNPSSREENADHVIKQLTGVLQQGAEGNNQFTNPKNPIFQVPTIAFLNQHP